MLKNNFQKEKSPTEENIIIDIKKSKILEIESYIEAKEPYLKLCKKLYLMKTVFLNFKNICGNIYSFSEKLFLLLIYQALEISLANHYIGDKFDSMMELYIYQLIITSLREDHQIVFSFYYSLNFLSDNDFSQDLEWKNFLKSSFILIILIDFIKILLIFKLQKKKFNNFIL